MQDIRDIEEEILKVLQKNEKDFMALSALSPRLKRRLIRPQKGAPLLGERLQISRKGRSTLIVKTVPPAQMVLNYVKAKPNLSPKQLAQRLPIAKDEVIEGINHLLGAGEILCAFKKNPDCTPSLRIAEVRQAPALDHHSAFKAAYEAVGKGKQFVDIHRVRAYLGWPREEFDAVLNELRRRYIIQLHGGDPSTMTEQEIQDAYLDENTVLYLNMTWKQK